MKDLAGKKRMYLDELQMLIACKKQVEQRLRQIERDMRSVESALRAIQDHQDKAGLGS